MTPQEINALIAQMTKYRRENFALSIRTSTDSLRKGYSDTVYLEWTTNGAQHSAATFTPDEARLLHGLLGKYLETNTTQTGSTA